MVGIVRDGPRPRRAGYHVEAVEVIAAASLERFTEHTPVRRADVVADLRPVRAQGYTISDEDVTIGIAAIGAPIFDHEGGVSAALSISGVKPAILGRDRERLRAGAVAGAAEISAALGHSADRSAAG